MGTSSPAFMGDYAAPADLRPLMDKELTLHSFYQVRPQYDAKIPGILAEATTMIVTGELYAPVAATYPLSAIKEAVAHAERGGKVPSRCAKGLIHTPARRSHRRSPASAATTPRAPSCSASDVDRMKPSSSVIIGAGAVSLAVARESRRSARQPRPIRCALMRLPLHRTEMQAILQFRNAPRQTAP
jgi:hypothetical protein